MSRAPHPSHVLEWDEEKKQFVAVERWVEPWPDNAAEILTWAADQYFAALEPQKDHDLAVVARLRKAWGLQN